MHVQFETIHPFLGGNGRLAASALMVHRYLERRSIADIGKIAQCCSITIPTVTTSIKHLEALGIVREITGKERRKIYAYKDYLDILSDGVAGI